MTLQALRRHARRHASSWRVVGLCLALAVLWSGWPRWEMHAHTAAELHHEQHGHGHDGDHGVQGADFAAHHGADVGSIDAHDSEQGVTSQGNQDPLLHVHESASLHATLPSMAAAELSDLRPPSWRIPFSESVASARLGPPPQRPPIA